MHLTTDDVADQLGISSSRVRLLCRLGRLGHKHGRDWVITAANVRQYLNRGPLPPGRPSLSRK